MKLYTIDEMMLEGPCYTRERVAELWGERKRCGALDFLDMPISPADKIWALSLPDVLTPEQNQAWKDVFVARAVTNHALTYTACPAVVEWAKAWLDGVDRTESAAWSAARSAAAWSAAESAAAWSAAWSAAESAAWSAARSAARSAEEFQQVEDLRAVLSAMHNAE